MYTYFLHNLSNVLVQISNKMRSRKKIIFPCTLRFPLAFSLNTYYHLSLIMSYLCPVSLKRIMHPPPQKSNHLETRWCPAQNEMSRLSSELKDRRTDAWMQVNGTLTRSDFFGLCDTLLKTGAPFYRDHITLCALRCKLKPQDFQSMSNALYLIFWYSTAHTVAVVFVAIKFCHLSLFIRSF
jgi:hypothetical protein